MAEVITKIIDNLNRYEMLTQLVAGAFLCVLLEKGAHVVLPLSGCFEKFMLNVMIVIFNIFQKNQNFLFNNEINK